MDFELWQLPLELWQLPLELWQLPLELWHHGMTNRALATTSRALATTSRALATTSRTLTNASWLLNCVFVFSRRQPYQTASSDSLIRQPYQTALSDSLIRLLSRHLFEMLIWTNFTCRHHGSIVSEECAFDGGNCCRELAVIDRDFH